MAKLDPGLQGDEPRGLGRLSRLRRDFEQTRGTPQHGRVTGGFGGGDEHQELRGFGEPPHLSEEVGLEAAADRQWIRQEADAGELLRAQFPGQLGHRQRATLGLGDDPPCDLRIDRPVDDRAEQLDCDVLGQAFDGEHRETLEGHMGLRGGSYRKEQRDAVGVQPAAEERERVERLAVEPLRIVDHADQRPVPRHFGKQRQRGEADQEPIRRWSGNEPEGRPQRVTLPTGKPVEAVHERDEEALERREPEVGLGFDARDPSNAHPGRGLDRVVEQRGLAHAGLTPEDENATAAPARRGKHAVDRSALLAPAQHAPEGTRDPRAL